jgi:hypothetical protein
MKVVETNGLFVLGEGVIELVAVVVDVLKAVLGMGVVGIQKEDSPHCPSSRSQSSFIHFIHAANGECASGKRWSMPRALSAASFALLNQRLDPGAGEGQGPTALSPPLMDLSPRASGKTAHTASKSAP